MAAASGFPDNGMVATNLAVFASNAVALFPRPLRLKLPVVRFVKNRIGVRTGFDLGESFQGSRVKRAGLGLPAVAVKAALKLRRDSDAVNSGVSRFRRQLHPSPVNDPQLGAMRDIKTSGRRVDGKIIKSAGATDEDFLQGMIL